MSSAARPGGGRQDRPPPRPRSLEDLRFRRRPPVRWFDPGVLANAALRLVVTHAFGAFLDKREMQEALDPGWYDHSDADELWLDYVADSGDGFSPTYAIAWLASQPQLLPDGHPRALPRGRVLVLGGDQVYPVASAEAYRERLVGPYQAALPWTDPEAGNHVYALPGNHDWYDGLTSFMRIFRPDGWLGGRRTGQARSYFALRLPGRWWLWGLDVFLDAYVDDPQLRYFRRVAREMGAGDRVILCSAKPSWARTGREPGAYRNLGFVERNLIEPSGARVALTLSGDWHHYARYRGDDGRHAVTAGGGGAFLHPTHHLGRALTVRLHPDQPDGPVVGMTMAEGSPYPDAGTSRRLLWRCLGLPLANPRFSAVTAALHVALGWSVLAGVRAAGGARSLAAAAGGAGFGDLVVGLGRNPVAALGVGALAGVLIAFVKGPWEAATSAPRWWPGLARVGVGLAHAAVHVLVHLAVLWAGVGLLAPAAAGLPLVVLLVAFLAVLGGAASAFVVGAYLGLANALGDAHGNDAFSAMRHTGYKNFVRLHIDRDGALRLYGIGVDAVPGHDDWVADPDPEVDAADPAAAAEAAWLRPAGAPPVARLVDGPELIDGPPGP